MGWQLKHSKFNTITKAFVYATQQEQQDTTNKKRVNGKKKQFR